MMKRLRFSLRAVLIVLTLAAVLLGAWRVLIRERPVMPEETMTVKHGMSELEVRWRLGGPHYVFEGDRETWGFEYSRAAGWDFDHFTVVFREGKVIEIEQTATHKAYSLSADLVPQR